MVKSNFVFESGDAIEVGSHGGHDFVYAGGEEVEDRGKSDYIFEAGTGLGPADWSLRFLSGGDLVDSDPANFSASIGGDPFLSMSHDGSETTEGEAAFGIFYRDNPVSSGNFEIEFQGCDLTRNAPRYENNFVVGVAATTTDRPYDNTDVRSIGIVWRGDDEENELFEYEDGSGTQTTIDISLPTSGDFAVGYDANGAYALVNGSEVARITGADNATYYPTVALEDDPDVTEGESFTVDGITERDPT